MRQHPFRARRRLAILVAGAVAAPAIVVTAPATPSAAVDPPPPPTAVTLSSGATTLGSQQSTTLTATAGGSVTDTGYHILIADRTGTTWPVIAACGTGSTCSVTRSFNSLANVERTYVAYVGTYTTVAPPSNTTATSNTVTIAPVPWSLTLTSTLTTLGSQDSATLTASTNQLIDGTNKYISIYHGNTRHAVCGTGTTCSVNASFSSLNNAERTFVAYLSDFPNSAPPAGTVATSNTVTLSPVAWSLTLTSTTTTVGSQDVATLTATANQSVAGTGKGIAVYNQSTGQRVVWCDTGSTCASTVSFTALANSARTYIAYVGSSSSSIPPPGVVATSNTVTLTPVTWSITLGSTHTSVGTQSPATLTATANQSVTGTGKHILIFDTYNSQRVTSCNTGTTCSATRSFNQLDGVTRPYVAYVANDAPSGLPPGIVATSNQVELAPVPWSLTLTTSAATVGSGQSATLTATVNQAVNGTGKYILIYDKGTGARLAGCNTGTTCSVTQSFTHLGDATHTYIAYVANDASWLLPPGVVATSGEVTVAPVPWSVTLTHTGGWIDAYETVTLTAQVNQSVSGTGLAIQIYDVTAPSRLVTCYTGTSCSVYWTSPQFPIHRLAAAVASASSAFPPPGLRARSNVVAAPTAFFVEGILGAASMAASALDPVNVATGNFYDSRSDIVFPSHVHGLAWTRTYNSRDRRVTTLGRGWSPAYSATATINPLGEVEVRADDGRLLVFTATGSGYAAPTGFPGRLTRLADGTFRLDDYRGSSTSFGADGGVVRLDFPDSTYVDVARANGRPTTVTSSLGYSLSFAYSIDGRLASVTASDGRVVSFTYTGSNLTSAAAPDGTTQYAYDSDNRLRTVTDPAGRVAVTNTYDDLDRVVSQQTAPGQVVTLSYSDDAARTTTVTETGATTVYTHDASGRVTKVVDSLGKDVTRTYGSTGYLAGGTDRRGTTSGATIDAYGNLTQRTLPGGTETYSYDAEHRLVSATDVRGKTTTFGYTGTSRVPTTIGHPDGTTTTQTVSGGVVTSVTDADGVTTSYTYDVARNVVAVTDGLGRATTMTYDAAGRLTSRTTPLGFTTSWTYDAAGRVTSVTDPNGDVASTTYDGAGNVLTETDEDGNVTSYAYDAANQLVSETAPDGTTTTYTYNGRGELLTETRPGGATTTYAYGALGRLATETAPTGEQTSYAYDANGLVTAVTDAGGGVTTTTYDAAGHVLTTTDALNRTTTYVRDAAGNITSTTEPTGAVTTRTYDDRGRVASETDALNRTTAHAYTPGGRAATTTYPGGATTTYGYDAAGRRTSVTDAVGKATVTAYDADGRTTSVTSPEGLVTSYTYDAAGRTLTTSVPGRGTTTTTYTDTGTVATRTDATGGVVAFGYDAAGRMTSATDANGQVTAFSYDARGNRVSMTDARNNVWSWAYDLSDRVTSATDPRAAVTTYAYDAAGRLATVTDATGRVRTTTYDVAGQVATQSYSDGSQVGYTYDAAGRVLTATDGTSTETTTYDAVGNLLSDSFGGRTIAYTYDARDRVATITYPDGSVATNAYDLAGRLTGVARTGGGTATYTYDDDGRVLTETLPGGVARSYQYTAGALATYTETSGGTSAATSIARDAAGRITAAGATTYAYDPAGQLTSVDAPGTSADESYVYDVTGNPTAVTTGGVASTRTYDAAGRVSTSTTGGTVTTYTFDDAGRFTASDDGTTATSSSYDAAGRLTASARTGAGTTTWTRSYTPLGRLARVVTGTGGSATTTDLTWHVARGIPQVATMSDGGVTTNIFYGSGKAFATTGSGAAEPFSRDALGSLLTTPGTATAVRAGGYHAYGTPDTGGDTPVFGYRGELHVGDQIHLRAREYDPATERFLTRDPLDGHPGQPVVANPYHYATNDPINSADPTGLDPAITDYSYAFLAPPAAPTLHSVAAAENACVEAALAPGQSRSIFGSLGDRGGAVCGTLGSASFYLTVATGAAVVGTTVAILADGSNSGPGQQRQQVNPKPKPKRAPEPSPTLTAAPKRRDRCEGYDDASRLPDDALVVRGGESTTAALDNGAECIDNDGLAFGISVNSWPGADLRQLARGLPNRQLGVTTVGAVRRNGGDVLPRPTSNTFHAVVVRLSPHSLAMLMRPTQLNPWSR